MTAPISMISSMATRALLAELVAGFERGGGGAVTSLAIGGVDAAKRVRAGEAFDVVALASNAIDALIADGHVRAGSRVDLVQSGVAVAVRAGTPPPPLRDAADVRAAVLAAPSVGFSTGPSGVELVKLFTAWGLGEHLAERTVTAPPGVPVGALVADGRVALGFQQLSELMGLAGVDTVGPLPPDVQITTTFSAGIATVSAQPEAAHALIAHLAAPAAADVKRRHGMEPA